MLYKSVIIMYSSPNYNVNIRTIYSKYCYILGKSYGKQIYILTI